MHLDLLDGVIHSAKLAAGIIAARLLATPCDLLERRLVSLLSAACRFLLDRLRATAAAHCRHPIIAAGNPGASESQPSGSHAPVRRGLRTLLQMQRAGCWILPHDGFILERSPTLVPLRLTICDLPIVAGTPVLQ